MYVRSLTPLNTRVAWEKRGPISRGLASAEDVLASGDRRFPTPSNLLSVFVEMFVDEGLYAEENKEPHVLLGALNMTPADTASVTVRNEKHLVAASERVSERTGSGESL